MLEKLRLEYPWPKEKPVNITSKYTDWFTKKNQEVLSRFLSKDTLVVVELGSWQGLSAMFLAEKAPNATIICIDHWLGSVEHKKHREWKLELPTLYETFLLRLWPWKDRVIPLRKDTISGLTLLKSYGIQPDVVYIDAAHDHDSVYNDFSTTTKFFPKAIVVGDDANMSGVRSGINRVKSENKQLNVCVERSCWYSIPNPDPLV